MFHSRPTLAPVSGAVCDCLHDSIPKISVRLAKREDEGFVKRANLRLLQETGRMAAYQPDQVVAGVDDAFDLPEKFGRYYLAEVAGQDDPVGQLKIRAESHDFKGEVWWIEHVYVAKAFRGQSVLSTLFNHVEHLAAQSGIETILLRVVLENERAIRAYRRLGLCESMFVMEKPVPRIAEGHDAPCAEQQTRR